MELLNKKQRNNGGFSLVELIVVIAIMVVLVAVLAPLFSKYIESSRRSTDVQNASSIAEAVMADVADGKITASDTYVVVTDNNVSAITKQPKTKGDAVKADDTFSYHYTGGNQAEVFVTSDTAHKYNLAIEGEKGEDGKYTNGAGAYKEAASAD